VGGGGKHSEVPGWCIIDGTRTLSDAVPPFMHRRTAQIPQLRCFCLGGGAREASVLALLPALSRSFPSACYVINHRCYHPHPHPHPAICNPVWWAFILLHTCTPPRDSGIFPPAYPCTEPEVSALVQ